MKTLLADRSRMVRVYRFMEVSSRGGEALAGGRCLRPAGRPAEELFLFAPEGI